MLLLLLLLLLHTGNSLVDNDANGSEMSAPTATAVLWWLWLYDVYCCFVLVQGLVAAAVVSTSDCTEQFEVCCSCNAAKLTGIDLYTPAVEERTKSTVATLEHQLEHADTYRQKTARQHKHLHFG